MFKKVVKVCCFSYLSYCTYQYFEKAGPLKIEYNHQKLKEIIKLNPSLSQKVYYPSFFFSSGHIQTIIVMLMNKLERAFKFFGGYNYSKARKIIRARDGEDIYVDFFEKSSKIETANNDFTNFDFLKKFDNSNIMIIIPGTCGRSGEFYITDVMEKFLAENFKVITINHRGILKFPLKNSRLYHCGYTDDLTDVFDFISKNIKGSKYFLLGFSMGGNTVTKFAGELGDKAKDYNIYGGCALCGPLDMRKFTNYTEESSKTKIYSKSFLKSLRSVFTRNKQYLLKHLTDIEKEQLMFRINNCTLASDFYKNFILDSFGFKSVEEFEKYASGSTYVKNIKIPFLCIFAEDDPLIPSDTLDDSGYEQNENFVLAKTLSGGHIGFYKGFYFERWIHEPVIEFIRDVACNSKI